MNLLDLLNYFKTNQRFKENTKYQTISFAIKILVQIFFPVLMIMSWGTDIFGIWIILLTIISTIYGLNMNVTEVTRIEMTQAYNKNNLPLLEKLYVNGNLAQIINLIFFTFILLIALRYLDLEIYKNLNIDLKTLNNCLYFIILAFYVEGVTYFFYSSLTYKGFTKIWVNQNSLYQLYSKFFLVLAFYFHEFYFIGFFLLVSNLLRLAIIFYFHKKNNKNININFALLDFLIIKNIFIKSLSYTLEKINFLLRQNGIILIIAKFFTPTTVTLVSTARTLFYYLPINFFDIISHSSIIEFSKSDKKNSILGIVDLFKKFLILLSIFGLVYLICSMSIGKLVYEFWIRDINLQITNSFILYLSIDAVLIGLLNLIYAPFKSLNNFLFLTEIDFYFTLFNIILIIGICFFINSLNLIFIIILINHLLLFCYLKFNFNKFLNRVC